jgi:phospholipase C
MATPVARWASAACDAKGRNVRKSRVVAAVAGLAAVLVVGVAASGAAGHGSPGDPGQDNGGLVSGSGSKTTTPIQHLVVIFQENVSFDHYFATYPNAANPGNEPAFRAARDTPSIDGLNTPLAAPANENAAQPFRLDRSQFETCDQDHNYKDEQAAAHAGLMDQFVEKVGRGGSVALNNGSGQSIPCDYGKGASLVMGYYDGNTVTALWNYAQHFAMNDNSYGTVFGPSAPGALNLVSGQTHGFGPDVNPFSNPPGAVGTAVTPAGTVVGDPQPAGDICDSRDGTSVTDPKDANIGDLLNAKNVTWGWFQGGFRATGKDAKGQPTTNTCAVAHADMAGVASADYIPHHEPFQYYPSTRNLLHLPPLSAKSVGHTDAANHQYDLSDFWNALAVGNMPAVSFLKASGYQDGHAGYSDPLDEQQFLVNTINKLERSPFWSSTAVVVAYDDSDGWYDHRLGPVVNQSQDASQDLLANTDLCGLHSDAQHQLGQYQDRCGYGPRLPLLVISPWAQTNVVDHTTTDQTSVLRFIEDNWQTGQIGNFSFDSKAGSLDNMFAFHPVGPVGDNKVFLDPATGQVVGH